MKLRILGDQTIVTVHCLGWCHIMTPVHVPRFLFSFSTEFVVCRRIEIFELDLENLKVSARGYGETPGEIYGDETATKSHGGKSFIHTWTISCHAIVEWIKRIMTCLFFV